MTKKRPVSKNWLVSGTFIMFMLAALLFFAAGCEGDSAWERFKSDEAVTRFLKDNHFEVPVEPIPLPDFEYTLLDGTRETLSSNRGTAVFLNFWATWCYPCRKEMPDMEALVKLMKGERFRILAVNFDDDENKIRQFLDRYKYSFDIVVDTDQAIASGLAVKGLPTTLVIDTAGRLVGRLVGPADWKKEGFRDLFKALSRKQS